MNWKDYEKEVQGALLDAYPNARIVHNVKVPGRHSQVMRQIDVLVEGDVAGTDGKIIVEAKYLNRPVGVSHVDSLVGKLDDVEAKHGMIVTPSGYTKAAINRAYRDTRTLELDTLSIAQRGTLQAKSGIPYAGENALFVPAPFGWIVDGRRTPFWLAAFYDQGHNSVSEAAETGQWMYVQLWAHDPVAANAEQLIAAQTRSMRRAYTGLSVTLDQGPRRQDGVLTHIRTATWDGFPYQEVTGYVDFDLFVAFFVLFTPPQLILPNGRKLRQMLYTALPMTIRPVSHRK